MALSGIRYDERGLVPVVVQEDGTGAVLMLAYANEEALNRTLTTGRVWFWSRSRGELWQKGETSGSHLLVRSVRYDCDGDAVLVTAEATGPACHTGQHSCFYRPLTPPQVDTATPAQADTAGFQRSPAAPPPSDGGHRPAGSCHVLAEVYETIRERKANPPPGSYVAGLLRQGRDGVLRKVSEEATEVLLAAKDGDGSALVHEIADLWFHTLVLMGMEGIEPARVFAELAARRGRRRAGIPAVSPAGEPVPTHGRLATDTPARGKRDPG